MSSIAIGDQRHISAAQGWLMLGNRREARLELEQLSPEAREHPEALKARYELGAAEELWAEAYALACRLVQLQSSDPAVWVWRAYAARRMPGGGLEQAVAALLPAEEQFSNEWIFPFNLACYACLLGRLDEARRLYRKAFRLGGKAIREMALSDPDLERLHDEISGGRL